MKTIKILAIILFSALTFSCSSDDDSSSGDEPTTLELLTTGTWYLESKTPNDFSDCEKNSSFKFNTDNTLNAESFEDGTGTCESDGVVNTTYTLTGDTLVIIFGSDTITATINSISDTILNITDDEGDTIVFDKTQG